MNQLVSHSSVIGIALASSMAMAAPIEKSFPAASVRSVEIENGAGQIEVRADAKDQATVKADMVKGDEHCRTEIKLDGSTLKVDVERERKFFGGGECEVNIAVSIPEAANVEVDTGSGNISIEGGRGELDVETGSGNVKGKTASNAVEVKSGSGSVSLEDLTGRAEVKVGSGNVDLAWDELKGSERIAVTTGSGNVTLHIPAGVKVNPSVVTGSGQLNNEIGSDQSGVKVEGTVGSGNFTIKKAVL